MPESPDARTDPSTSERSRGRHAAAPRHRGLTIAVVIVALAVLAGAGGLIYRASKSTPQHPEGGSAALRTPPPRTTTTSPATTSTSLPGTHGPITSPPLPVPGPGFTEGQVTAVGDSVMLDYQDPLQADIPGINVDAGVSRQWAEGETILEQLKAEGHLGAVVIVGLSTNGPIAQSDFDSMMSILAGASRVVFVTVHVDRPWQDPNNGILAQGVKRFPNAVLADWNSVVTQNPAWVYSDGTHLPINGTGAQALAALVASKS